MAEKYCPLIAAAKEAADGLYALTGTRRIEFFNGKRRTECTGKRCAWWNAESGCCAVSLIGRKED